MASPAHTLLILSNSKGEQLPIDLDITSMPKIPKGWEWAKNPLTHLINGIKTVRENERKMIGKNAIFEGYQLEGGIFALSENGRFGGQFLPAGDDSAYVQIEIDKKKYPAIVFDAQMINKFPKNAGFYAGHELAHHYNYVPGAIRNYSEQQLSQFGGRALVHSAQPLFGISANMDLIGSIKKGNLSESLQIFTETRTPEPDIQQIPRESEMLADAVGTILSGVHPKFDDNFNRKVQPLNSPLVKRYVEDVFMQDVLLRANPTQENITKRNALYSQLTNPKHVLGDETSFRYVTGIEDKFMQETPISPAEMDKARKIMEKSYDNFHKQRKALTPAPKKKSAIDSNPLEDELQHVIASLQANKAQLSHAETTVAEVQQIANAEAVNSMATTQPVVKVPEAKTVT